jgi:hypothetical protein
MTWIGRKLTAGADQQHIRRLAQTCELAFIIEDDGLDTGALGNEPQEPRLAATRISLNEKARVDQRRKVELKLLTTDDLSNDHRHSLTATSAASSNTLLKWLRREKRTGPGSAQRFNYRPPTNRMPQSPRPIAESPNRAQIDAITISMSFSGDRGADVAR